MKNIAILFIVLVLVIGSLGAQDAPFIKQVETGFLPVTKSNFRPQISISPQLGYFSFSSLESSGIGYGLELAMQCPLACTNKNYIRQQISFLTYSDDALNYDYWTVGINPEYRLLVTPAYEVAIGPSVGYFNSNIEDSSSSGISYGVSSSFTVHFGRVMIGLSPRYLLSKDISILEESVSQNSFVGILKLGYKI